MVSALMAVQVQALGNIRNIEARDVPAPRSVEDI